MSQARRARRVLAAVACTVAVASAGCRSPLHGLADVAKRGEPEAVATVDRKDLPELAPEVAVAARPTPSPAISEPSVEAVEAVAPTATPLLDAALRRAEAAEEARKEATREVAAAARRPSVEPTPEPPRDAEPAPAPPVVADAPEPTPAPEPTAPPGIEIKATLEPPVEEGSPADEPDVAPRSDPAVQPASAESVANLIPEVPAETPTPEPPAVAEPSDDDDEAAAPADVQEAPAPALTIDAVRLCRKIRGFGSYDPLADQTLRPGRSVLVYCELSGLEYRPDGDGFAARVATRVELVRTDDGAKVWEVADGAVDRGPARRRDVYVGTMVTLPDSVPPGEYALRLYQADAATGRSAVAEIPVTIAR